MLTLANGLFLLTQNFFAAVFLALSVTFFVCCLCKEIYDSKK